MTRLRLPNGPRPTPSRFPSAWAVLFMTSILSTAGCDLGTYSSRYSDRLPQLQRRAQLAGHLHEVYQTLEISNVIEGRPAVINGNSAVGAQIRLPKIFDAESRKLGPGDPVSVASPPGVVLPIGLSYERYITNENSDRLPIYFYLMAVPTEIGDMTTLETTLKEAVSAVVEKPGGWETVTFQTLDDQTIDFRAMRISQAQPFVVQLVDNAPQPQTLEGQLHFYARTVGDRHLVFIFRYPSQMADSLGFPEAIEASLGTLR